jgi:hypothetical protein
MKTAHTGSEARKAQQPLEPIEPQTTHVDNTKDKKKRGKEKKTKGGSAIPGFNGDLQLSTTESSEVAEKPSAPSLKDQHISIKMQHSKDGVLREEAGVDPVENEKRFEKRLGQIMKVYETRVATLEKKHAKHLKCVEERLESSEAIQKQLVRLNEKLTATSEHNLKLAALVLKRLPDQQQLLQTQNDMMMIDAMKNKEEGNDPASSLAATVLAQASASK